MYHKVLNDKLTAALVDLLNVWPVENSRHILAKSAIQCERCITQRSLLHHSNDALQLVIAEVMRRVGVGSVSVLKWRCILVGPPQIALGHKKSQASWQENSTRSANANNIVCSGGTLVSLALTPSVGTPK